MSLPSPISMNNTTNDSAAIKVVFIAEGFQSNQLTLFDSMCDTAKKKILSYNPFCSNRNKFKFHKCRAASVDAGVYKIPKPGRPAFPPIMLPPPLDTAVRCMSDGRIGTDWFQLANQGRLDVDDYATTHFSDDKVFFIVIVNCDIYGNQGEHLNATSLSSFLGVSDLNSVVSIISNHNYVTNDDWLPMMIANFARGLGDLDYEFVNTAKWFNMQAGLNSYAKFMTTYALRDNVKDTDQGSWTQGARYESTGKWKSTDDCLMDSRGWGDILCPINLDLVQDGIDALSGTSPELDIPTNFVTVGAVNPSSDLDIIFIGDGYLSSQSSLFNTHVDNAKNHIMSKAPFSTNASKINFHKLFTASEDEGASVTKWGIPSGPYYKVHDEKHTFWKAYSHYGDYRVYEQSWKSRQLLDEHIKDNFGNKVSHVIMLINQTSLPTAEAYGGAAYGPVINTVTYAADPVYGLVNTHCIAVQGGSYDLGVMAHEFGHSFGGFSEEYNNTPAMTTAQATAYKIAQPYTAPNITYNTSTDPKWNSYLGSPSNYHAWGPATSIWKSSATCIMKEVLTSTIFSESNQYILQKRIDIEQ